MKFLIAGLGSIGRRHMRNLIALGEKDIVLVRTRKATLPEEELSSFPQETDLQAALKKHKPYAIIVANPTALHLDVAIPAAEAGCTILLEKPISHSTERLDQLEAAVKKSGSKVLVGFQFRFHPGLLRAKQLIADGEIGRLISNICRPGIRGRIIAKVTRRAPIWAVACCLRNVTHWIIFHGWWAG